MNADRSRARALASSEEALELVRQRLWSPGLPLGSVERRQLELCERQLRVMLGQLHAAVPPAQDDRVQGMAQMAADQWDPVDNLTAKVVEAEQDYLAVRSDQ